MQIPSMICSNELLMKTKVDFYFNVFLISWLISLLLKKTISINKIKEPIENKIFERLC